jgi:hypothetical protein
VHFSETPKCPATNQMIESGTAFADDTLGENRMSIACVLDEILVPKTL